MLFLPHHLRGSAHLVVVGCGWFVLISWWQQEVKGVDSWLPHCRLLWDLHQDRGGHLHMYTCTQKTHIHSKINNTNRLYHVCQGDFLLLSSPDLLRCPHWCTGKVSWRPELHLLPWNRLQHLLTPSEWGCSVEPTNTHTHRTTLGEK